MTELNSRVISSLRFPMMVAVIAIHCNFVIYYPELETRTIFNFLFSLTVKLIRVGVPVFFFISGMLFFKEGTLDIPLYLKKLRNRIHSLLIPYILWNIIYFGIIIVLQLIIPDFLLLLHKPIVDFCWQDYLWIFWDIRQITHLPDDQASCLVGAFWFLQCLFFMCITSPVLFMIINTMKHAFIILPLSVLFFLPFDTIAPGIQINAIVYFSIGAYISIMKIDYTSYLRLVPRWLSLLTIILMLFSTFIDNEYIETACTLLLQVAILSLFTYQADHHHWKIKSYLLSSTFFIFAVHRLFTASLIHISGRITGYIHNDILLYVYYLFVVAIAVIISVIAYLVLLRILPRVTYLLNGSRS